MDFPEILRWIVFLAYLILVIGAGATFRKTGEARGRTLPFVVTIWILVWQSRNTPPDVRMVVPAGILLLAGLTLFQWAMQSVRGKFFSYLGDSDTPQFLHQTGPYAYIRNPFYASYNLVNFAVALVYLNWITVAAAAACYGILWYTARFEERKFESSPLAEEYRAYVSRTGRFFPRLARH
jgi:protein-S-isoprenylcysteine O-methyltransferase Ste14